MASRPLDVSAVPPPSAGVDMSAQAPSALPDELWQEVWSRLDVSERIAASHVCRRWRAVALHCPTLWTDILIFPVSNGRSRALFGSNERTQAFLDRSAHAPLSCVIDVPDYADDAEVRRLANMLSAHWPRVASLQLYCARAGHRTMLIPATTPLPRLADLGIHSVAERYMFISAMGLPVMPALTSFSLADSVAWDVVPTFPALLKLEAWFSHPDHLLSALQSCPRLSTLDASLKSTAPIPPAQCSKISQAVSRLREVHVRFLAPWDELFDEHSLAAFGDSRVRAITFDYHDYHSMNSPQPVPGLCVLRQLQGAVSLAIASKNKRLNVVGRDSGGRRRTVTWDVEDRTHNANIGALWATLSPDSVTSLCVDCPLIAAVLRTQGSFPALETLAFRLPSPFADQFGISAIIHTIVPLPSLTKLSLQSDATVTFSSDELAEFLSKISPSRRVGALELCNVRFQGDADLDSLVEKVVNVSF